jgi:DNA-binding NtrC family response regulator
MSNNVKIIVIDDEKIVLDCCRRVLSAEGFEIILLNSAAGAQDIIQTENPALLLIDIKMPIRDGLSLMEELKEKMPEVPIIAMSGYPTPETISDAAKKGALRFVPKPFTPDELIETIRQVLSEKRKDLEN